MICRGAEKPESQPPTVGLERTGAPSCPRVVESRRRRRAPNALSIADRDATNISRRSAPSTLPSPHLLAAKKYRFFIRSRPQHTARSPQILAPKKTRRRVNFGIDSRRAPSELLRAGSEQPRTSRRSPWHAVDTLSSGPGSLLSNLKVSGQYILKLTPCVL
jgi:hypothetical protein